VEQVPGLLLDERQMLKRSVVKISIETQERPVMTIVVVTNVLVHMNDVTVVVSQFVYCW